MANDLEWYIEADRRGLLSGDDKAWFDEAKRRGLVDGAAQAGAQPAAPDGAQAKQPEEVSVAGDLAKSAGIGLIQGAIGLGTLPGNIEKLGRLGINGVSRFLGAGPAVSPETLNPITYDTLKARLENRFGEFYKPQSVAGEYARTLGEMVPNAIGGAATVGGKVASVVGPALFSETAGQVAKGSDYEGLARFGGAIAGGIAGPTMVSRAVTPVRSTPEAMQAADALEAAGVQGLTAGQRTGNRALRVAEQVTDYVPFSGRRNQQMADTANRTYTQAAMRAAGLNEPGVLDQDNLQRMFREIGREYDNVRIGTNVQYTPQFLRRMQRLSRDYYDNVEAGATVGTVRNLVDDLTNRANTAIASGQPILSGTQYQVARSRLSKAAQNAKDPTTQHTLRRMVDTLDAQAIRSLPAAQRPAARAYMRDLNQRYRGLKTMEEAVDGPGSNSAMGLVSSAGLKKAAKKGSKADYTRGRTAVARLANTGERVMERLPDSGTAQRSAMLKFMSGENASKIGLGVAAGGSGLGMMDAVTGGLGLATGAGLSRTLMAPWMQRYLSNRVYPQGMPLRAPGALGQAWRNETGLPPLPREAFMLTLPAIGAKDYAPLMGSQQGLTADELEEQERGAFQ